MCLHLQMPSVSLRRESILRLQPLGAACFNPPSQPTNPHVRDLVTFNDQQHLSPLNNTINIDDVIYE
uniref:Ovule protein n=1 Tax=Panagrellus redivivus TaxID=6233 RepID=A0A7E4VT20_PANRE